MKFKDTRNAKQRADTREVVAIIKTEHNTGVFRGPERDDQGDWRLCFTDIDHGAFFFHSVEEAREMFEQFYEDGVRFPLDIELVPVDRCSFCGRARISPYPEPPTKKLTCQYCQKIQAAKRAWDAKKKNSPKKTSEN